MSSNTLNFTPSANRTHIVFLGKMNSGKSSLINALCNQKVSIVSSTKGTTTDAVKKPMEIHGIGACVLIDTAGFDDIGELGTQRVQSTNKAATQADIAVIVVRDSELEEEKKWIKSFEQSKTPIVVVHNKTEDDNENNIVKQAIYEKLGVESVLVDASTGEGIDEFRQVLIDCVNNDHKNLQIVGNLVEEDDIVMLVMPQDIQAPEGRLILPQVQTIRELLDKKCVVICVTEKQIETALKGVKNPPKLIITDSQIFKKVYELKPKESKLTSFSVLFAALKGDIKEYVKGANKISELNEKSKVLIAECCTHAPLEEDIGRVKIPALLRKRVGAPLKIDVVSGMDFPEDVKDYDLIIQCGACMYNRKYVLSRIARAKEKNVAITNYGIAIAYMNGILDKIEIPE